MTKRQELEQLIEEVHLLSGQMKLLAAEHAHQQLAEQIQMRQGSLETLFSHYMDYLTEEDLSRINHILLIDKEIAALVGDYQSKVRQAFETNKQNIKAHQAYLDQKK